MCNSNFSVNQILVEPWCAPTEADSPTEQTSNKAVTKEVLHVVHSLAAHRAKRCSYLDFSLTWLPSVEMTLSGPCSMLDSQLSPVARGGLVDIGSLAMLYWLRVITWLSLSLLRVQPRESDACSIKFKTRPKFSFLVVVRSRNVHSPTCGQPQNKTCMMNRSGKGSTRFGKHIFRMLVCCDPIGALVFCAHWHPHPHQLRHPGFSFLWIGGGGVLKYSPMDLPAWAATCHVTTSIVGITST